MAIGSKWNQVTYAGDGKHFKIENRFDNFWICHLDVAYILKMITKEYVSNEDIKNVL